jgi:hypothetical protein
MSLVESNEKLTRQFNRKRNSNIPLFLIAFGGMACFLAAADIASIKAVQWGQKTLHSTGCNYTNDSRCQTESLQP